MLRKYAFILIEITRELTNQPKFILSSLISVLILFSGLLCYDYSASAAKHENEILGYITYTTRVIKTKADSTVVWYDAENKQAITRRDTIRSDELSNAVVTLNDGTELRIDENSMVILDFSGKNIKLDFKYGSIQTKRKVNGDTTLEIIAGDSKVDLVDGDLLLSKDENGPVKVISNRGEANVSQGKHKAILKENEKLETRKDGKPNVSTRGIILLTPEPMKFISSKHAPEAVSFLWKNSTGESLLEIGKENQFKNIYYSRNLNTYKDIVKLPIGSYFWRIKSKNEVSEPSKFTIIEDLPIFIRSPRERAEFTMGGNPLFVNFAWNHLADVKHYTVEISQDKNFKSILKKQESKTNAISVELMGEGTYYFRIATVFNNPDFASKYSATRSFLIKKVSKLPPPILVNPTNAAVLDHKERILLNWGAEHYDTFLVKVSLDANFASNIFEKEISTNYISLPALEKNKTYHWYVEGKASKINEKNASKVNHFFVQEVTGEILSDVALKQERNIQNIVPNNADLPSFRQPILSEPKSELIVEEGKIPSLKFSWTKQEAELTYILSIYKKNPDGVVLFHNVTTTKNFLNLMDPKLLEKGEYTWYVEALLNGKNTKPQIKKSESRNYTILPALTPPKIKKSSDVFYLED